MHPNDWKVFYSFVRACHYHHKKIYIERLLVLAGFSEEYASRLQIVFDHCYEVLDAPIPRLAISFSMHYEYIIYNNVMNNVKKSCFGKIYLEGVVKAKLSKKNELILTLEGWAENIEIKKEFLKDLKRTLSTVKIEIL